MTITLHACMLISDNSIYTKWRANSNFHIRHYLIGSFFFLFFLFHLVYHYNLAWCPIYRLYSTYHCLCHFASCSHLILGLHSFSTWPAQLLPSLFRCVIHISLHSFKDQPIIYTSKLHVASYFIYQYIVLTTTLLEAHLISRNVYLVHTGS